MALIDAQIHAPLPAKPIGEAADEDLALLLSCELAREAMDSVGVDLALLHSKNTVIEYFIERYPDRFWGCPSYPVRADGQQGVRDSDLDEIATSAGLPQMRAIRVPIVDWQNATVQHDFSSGQLEPLFTMAEARDLPVFCFASGVIKHVEPIVAAHPDLTLVVDHLGIPAPPQMKLSADRWEDLPHLLALAAYPNVAVKIAGLPALSTQPYPFDDLWPHLHRVLDSFGPERVMWGSDFTRLRGSLGTMDRSPREQWGGLYSDSATFLRETDHLSENDKELLLGATITSILSRSGTKEFNRKAERV